MKRVAYTSFVAFVASILTLVAVYWLPVNTSPQGDDDVRSITLAELSQHDDRTSCWQAINGDVYDITEYIPQHPAPPEVLLEWCGTDATEGWDDKGIGRPHSASAGALLPEYLIGVLEAD